jgi:uncharacterized membrane protein
MNMDNDLVVDIERRTSRRNRRSPRTPELLAWGLGWFSIGLGVAQLVAPRAISRLTGVPMPAAFTRLCGAREIACGLGVLSQEQPATWVQARIAGDTLDLAALGAALVTGPRVSARRAAVTAAAMTAITALDVYCSRELTERRGRTFPRHVRATVDVARTPEEVYAFWRNLENLPRVMPHLDSVQVLDEIHSHWVARGPAGMRVEWDSEIIDDEPDQRLAWRTVEGSQLYNAGSVELQSAGPGVTRVNVELLYEPPGGTLGLAIAKLLGRDPEREVRADLRAFKQLLESGEYPANLAV